MTMNSGTSRNAFIDGLHELADLLDTNPDLPLPWQGPTPSNPITWFIHEHSNTLDQALALRDLLTDPKMTRDTGHFPVQFTGHICGLHVQIYVAAALALADPADMPPREPALHPRLLAAAEKVPA